MDNVIPQCPPQATPISEAFSETVDAPRLFSRSWWLYLKSLANSFAGLLNGGNAGQPFLSNGPGVSAGFGAMRVQQVVGVSGVTLSIVAADVPDLTLSLAPGLYLIWVVLQVDYNVDSSGVDGFLYVAGSAVTAPILQSKLNTAAGIDTKTEMLGQVFEVGIAGDVNTTVKVKAAKILNAGAASAGGPASTLTALQIG